MGVISRFVSVWVLILVVSVWVMLRIRGICGGLNLLVVHRPPCSSKCNVLCLYGQMQDLLRMRHCELCTCIGQGDLLVLIHLSTLSFIT